MKKRIVWSWFFDTKAWKVKSYEGLRFHHSTVPKGWTPLHYYSDHRDRRMIMYHWKQYIIRELMRHRPAN